jgi:hypothetical protein
MIDSYPSSARNGLIARRDGPPAPLAIARALERPIHVEWHERPGSANEAAFVPEIGGQRQFRPVGTPHLAGEANGNPN